MKQKTATKQNIRKRKRESISSKKSDDYLKLPSSHLQYFYTEKSIVSFHIGYHSVKGTVIRLLKKLIHYHYTSLSWKYLVQRFGNGLQSTGDYNKSSESDLY